MRVRGFAMNRRVERHYGAGGSMKRREWTINIEGEGDMPETFFARSECEALESAEAFLRFDQPERGTEYTLRARPHGESGQDYFWVRMVKL